MRIDFKINNRLVSFELEGETQVGGNEILLLEDENLIDQTDWSDVGFTIAPFLSLEEYESIRKGIKQLIIQKIDEAGGKTDDEFTLENYHLYVNDEKHLDVAKRIQFGWDVCQFPIPIQHVNHRISSFLNQAVTTKAKHIDLNNFFVRIVRPSNLKDNNPPHRDVWLDRLRDAVNLYVPLCGSNEHSSLGVVAGSHLLQESSIERTAQGAILNGTTYTVPSVISIMGEIPMLERPNPGENEMLLFSPYLVHGGGYNFNTDMTRISLEMRFWRKEDEK